MLDRQLILDELHLSKTQIQVLYDKSIIQVRNDMENVDYASLEPRKTYTFRDVAKFYGYYPDMLHIIEFLLGTSLIRQTKSNVKKLFSGKGGEADNKVAFTLLLNEIQKAKDSEHDLKDSKLIQQSSIAHKRLQEQKTNIEAQLLITDMISKGILTENSLINSSLLNGNESSQKTKEEEKAQTDLYSQQDNMLNLYKSQILFYRFSHSEVSVKKFMFLLIIDSANKASAVYHVLKYAHNTYYSDRDSIAYTFDSIVFTSQDYDKAKEQLRRHIVSDN